MVKQHMKRLAAPRSWPIKRKATTFIMRPYPGAHTFANGMPLGFILRDVLGITKSMRETKAVLFQGKVLVNKHVRKDPAFMAGLMDILEIPSLKQQFRILMNTHGKLTLTPVPETEASQKPCQIKSKNIIAKGKTAYHLSDGFTLIAEAKPWKIKETLFVSLPDYTVTEHFAFAIGMTAYIIGGSHTGETGAIKNILGTIVTLGQQNNKSIEVPLKYIFIVGKDKPAITIAKGASL